MSGGLYIIPNINGSDFGRYVSVKKIRIKAHARFVTGCDKVFDKKKQRHLLF